MLEALHMREYTRELKKRLPEHVFRPVPLRAFWLIPHLAIIAAATTAMVLLDPPTLVLLALSLVIGSSFASLGFLAHDILHGSVVRTPWLRDLLGGISFAPFALPPRVWRRWHNTEHHGHTQNRHQDPDAMATLEEYRERPALQAFYRIMPVLRSALTFLAFGFWFSMHGLLVLVGQFKAARPRERRRILAELFLPIGFWTLLLIWLGPLWLVFGYLIPLAVANAIVMSYIATNHLLNPLSEVNDPLITSLSVTGPRIIEWWHMGFGHHTEHHVFPAVSPRFARLIRAELKRLWPERFHEMPHWQALRLLWKTPRLYQHEWALVDPQRALSFPVLGSGLESGNPNPHPVPGGVARSEPSAASSSRRS